MKLYDKYKSLKENNSSTRYLFKSGNFYIFLSDDAKFISSITTLKLTSFGSTVKCGFPVTSLDKYLLVFKNIGVDILLIESRDDIIRKLNNVKLSDFSKEELSNLNMTLNNKTKIYKSSENINFIGVRKNILIYLSREKNIKIT